MQAYDESDSDPEFSKPLHHKRPFGAGLKRKRIDFVPQSTAADKQIRPLKPPAGDRYLSTVMPAHTRTDHERDSPSSTDTDPHSAPSSHPAITAPSSGIPTDTPTSTHAPSICPVCHLPINPTTTTPHASTLAHQVSIPHVHPPSHIDRHRKGLAYLSSYGWDADARLGLGAAGDGRLYPVQLKQREGRVGVGGDERVEGSGQGAKTKRRIKEVVRRANETRAEKVQRTREEERRRERMRMLILGRDEVNDMLGVEL